MTSQDFVQGMCNLRTRFGDKAFDARFTAILMKMVLDMPADWWLKTCDCFIGERKHTYAPLIVDFREAAHKEKQRISAARAFDYDRLMSSRPRGSSEGDGGWSKVVECLGNVKTPYEAVQIVIQKKRVNKATQRDEYEGLEIFRPKEAK